MKYFLFISLLTLSLSQGAWAQKVGVTLGISQVQLEVNDGVDLSGTSAYQMGGLFYQPLTESIEARLGALFATQLFTQTVGTVDTTITLSKLNVPLTAGYRMGERVLLFAGPVLSLNAGKKCENSDGSGCTVGALKVAGSDVQLSLGANFQLTSELGMELSYDRMGVKPMVGTSGGSVINVNFQYIIE